MLYGTGAASKTERWLNRDQSQHAAQYSMTGRRLGLGQSQQRFCTVSRFSQKSIAYSKLLFELSRMPTQ